MKHPSHRTQLCCGSARLGKGARSFDFAQGRPWGTRRNHIDCWNQAFTLKAPCSAVNERNQDVSPAIPYRVCDSPFNRNDGEPNSFVSAGSSTTT